jgi:hypothetical protein
MKNKSGWVVGGEQPSLPFEASETSRMAAESMASSAPGLRGIVLQSILLAGGRGMTDDEIEVETGLCHQTASARRRELVLSKHIRPLDERRKTRRGRLARVHVAVGVP